MEKIALRVEMVEIPADVMRFTGKLLIAELPMMGISKTIPEAISLVENRCVWVDREVVTDLNYRFPEKFELIVGNKGVRAI
jgi:hypothetical protein